MVAVEGGRAGGAAGATTTAAAAAGAGPSSASATSAGASPPPPNAAAPPSSARQQQQQQQQQGQQAQHQEQRQPQATLAATGADAGGSAGGAVTKPAVGRAGTPGQERQAQPSPQAIPATTGAGVGTAIGGEVKQEGGISTVGAVPAHPATTSADGPSTSTPVPTTGQRPASQVAAQQSGVIHQELNAIIGQKRQQHQQEQHQHKQHQQHQQQRSNGSGSQLSSPSSSTSSTPTTVSQGTASAAHPPPQQSHPSGLSAAGPGQATTALGSQRTGGVAGGNGGSAGAAATPGGGLKPPAAAAKAPAQASQGRAAVSTRGATTRGAQAALPASRPPSGPAGGISKSIEEACHAAALEDGVLESGGAGGKQNGKGGAGAGAGAGAGGDTAGKPSKQKNGLRRGKWTPEEEAYANRLIVEFKSGLLPLTDGTTLRTFLSKLLNCDPMRISKKFVGQNCIGKQVFRRRQQAEMDRLSVDEIERSRQELAELERRFLERVAQTNRCKNSAVGAKHGKDSATGQVAPDIPRRSQEYLGPNGQVVTNPVLPPWMLPPMPATAAASASSAAHAQQQQQQQQPPPPFAQGAAHALPLPHHLHMVGDGPGLEGNGSRPPHHPNAPATAAGGRLVAGPGALRRASSPGGLPVDAGLGAGLGGPAGTVGMMPRNESQDSLGAFGRTLSSDALQLHMGDLPRNSSLGDLAGLNMFTTSPFPSTDNLLGLVQQQPPPPPPPQQQQQQQQQQRHQTPQQQSPEQAASSGQQQPLSQTRAGATGSVAETGAAASPTSGWGPGAAVSASPALDAASPGAAATTGAASSGPGGAAVPTTGAAGPSGAGPSSRRMPRVESATGLSSLRVMSGLNRNTSVEDFFSLVESGAIPAPDKDLLSKCVFPSNPRQQPPTAAQQSAVAFTGIGKSSAVVPAGAAGAGDETAAAGAGPAGKRTRAGGAADGASSRAKQAKTGST